MLFFSCVKGSDEAEGGGYHGRHLMSFLLMKDDGTLVWWSY